MGQGLVVAILSILVYLSGLLGGGSGQPPQALGPQTTQESFFILGQNSLITADQVTIRQKPESESFPLGTAKQGEQAVVLAKENEWYKIQLNSGLDGWVPSFALTFTDAHPRDSSKVILSFYQPNEQVLQKLAAHGGQLTSVAPMGWHLNNYGELQTDFNPEQMGKSLYFAGNQGLDTFARLTMGNSLTRILTNSYLAEQSITNIVNTALDWGLKGIVLEFQSAPIKDQNQLFKFTQKLSGSLQDQGLKALLILPWDINIDYATAAQGIDYLVLNPPEADQLMAGPLQDISELEKMLAVVTEQINPTKIVLGLTTYGFDWPRGGMPTKLSHEQILELAASQGASIKWDAQAKAPYFHYGAGREVWFENRYSLKYKLDLVKDYGLAGIALPDLGLEDPEIWNILAKMG